MSSSVDRSIDRSFFLSPLTVSCRYSCWCVVEQVANVVGFYAAEIADAFTLNADKKPYNPLILTGALAVCGQLYPAYESSYLFPSFSSYVCLPIRQEPSARLQSCLEAYTGLSSPPQLPFNGCGTLSVSMPAYLTLSQDLDNKCVLFLIFKFSSDPHIIVFFFLLISRTRGVAHWLVGSLTIFSIVLFHLVVCITPSIPHV